MILLPETGVKEAKAFAERILTTTETLKVKVGKQEIRFTCSIGLADFGGEEDDVDSLVGRADKALYKAKNGGKNQVVISNTKHPK